MKTYSAKPGEITQSWHIIDASNAPLGRMSSEAARLLVGKHKPIYTPHIDCGDYVVITNADLVVVTGNKMDSKLYYRHSQYPGSLKSTTLKEQMEKDSARVVQQAVKGMLPKNKLAPARMKRLKVYRGHDHPHAPQGPVQFSLKSARKVGDKS